MLVDHSLPSSIADALMIFCFLSLDGALSHICPVLNKPRLLVDYREKDVEGAERGATNTVHLIRKAKRMERLRDHGGIR